MSGNGTLVGNHAYEHCFAYWTGYLRVLCNNCRLEYDAALLVLNAPSSRPLTLLESSDSCFKDRRSSCSLAISRFDSPDFMDDGTSIKWFRAKSVNSSECSMFLEHQNLQVETTFCTRGLGRSSCEILADGPLLSKRVQVGIPSRSNKATTCQDSLSAYTSVPTLLPWITAEIESLEEVLQYFSLHFRQTNTSE